MDPEGEWNQLLLHYERMRNTAFYDIYLLAHLSSLKAHYCSFVIRKC